MGLHRKSLSAWLAVLLSVLVASAAALAGYLAARLTMFALHAASGLSDVEVFLGIVVLPVLALFCAGLSLLLWQWGRARLRRRHRDPLSLDERLLP